MTVVFDAVSSNSGAAVGAPLTWLHTPVGTPTAVAVLLVYYTGAQVPNDVQYGGVSMTLAASQADPVLLVKAMWGLAGNPISWPADSTTSWNSGSGVAILGAGAITVTGSDPTTCFSGDGRQQWEWGIN